MALKLHRTKRSVPVVRTAVKMFPNSILTVNKRIPKLELLFNSVSNKAYILKKYSVVYQRRMPNFDDEFDVNKFWKPINAILKSNKLKATKWLQKLSDNNGDEILSNEQEEDEKSYFLSQLIRIPRMKDPNLLNILRVALNLGEYKGIVEGKGTNHNPTFIFNNIHDFIDATNLAIVSSKIDNKLVDEIIDYLNSIEEYEKPKMLNRTIRRKTRITNNTARNINAQLRNELIKNARKKIKPRARTIKANQPHPNVSL